MKRIQVGNASDIVVVVVVVVVVAVAIASDVVVE